MRDGDDPGSVSPRLRWWVWNGRVTPIVVRRNDPPAEPGASAVLALALVLLLLAVGCVSQQPPVTAHVLDRVDDSVVSLRVPIARNGRFTRYRAGTGVVLNDGTVVTAAHVLLGNDPEPSQAWTAIEVRKWDDRTRRRTARGRIEARAIATWDVAAITGVPTVPGVRPATLARREPQTGDAVAAFGLGGGARRTISSQVISRSTDGRFFAIALEPVEGDSGGPVFNARGELIGVIVGGGPPYEPWNADFRPGMDPPIHIRSIRVRRLPPATLCVDLTRALPALFASEPGDGRPGSR